MDIESFAVNTRELGGALDTVESMEIGTKKSGIENFHLYDSNPGPQRFVLLCRSLIVS